MYDAHVLRFHSKYARKWGVYFTAPVVSCKLRCAPAAVSRDQCSGCSTTACLLVETLHHAFIPVAQLTLQAPSQLGSSRAAFSSIYSLSYDSRSRAGSTWLHRGRPGSVCCQAQLCQRHAPHEPRSWCSEASLCHNVPHSNGMGNSSHVVVARYTSR